MLEVALGGDARVPSLNRSSEQTLMTSPPFQSILSLTFWTRIVLGSDARLLSSITDLPSQPRIWLTYPALVSIYARNPVPELEGWMSNACLAATRVRKVRRLTPEV